MSPLPWERQEGEPDYFVVGNRPAEFTASADKGGLDYQPNYIGCQTERTRQRISELKRSPFWRD